MPTHEDINAARASVKQIRAELDSYANEHADVFETYNALKEALNDQVGALESMLRTFEFRGEQRKASFDGVDVTRTTKTTVHANLIHKKMPGLFADHPEIVKGVDVDAVVRAYPAVFQQHPEVVSAVDDKQVTALVTRGVISKETFEAVSDTQTSTRITGLNELRAT